MSSKVSELLTEALCLDANKERGKRRGFHRSFYGNGLEVVYVTATHMPLARSQLHASYLQRAKKWNLVGYLGKREHGIGWVLLVSTAHTVINNHSNGHVHQIIIFSLFFLETFLLQSILLFISRPASQMLLWRIHLTFSCVGSAFPGFHLFLFLDL